MALLDLRPLVTANNIGPLSVLRAAAPVQNKYGDYDESAEATVTLDPVAVHTLNGRDLEQVPEADRNREVIQLYTTVRLFVADDGQAADRVVYRSRNWRVLKSEDYQLQGQVWCALATLEDA